MAAPPHPMRPEFTLHPSRLLDRQCAWAVLILLIFSVIAFAYVYALGATDLDGDGWSHVKRARVITDSLNPGYPQIGTVWLPLFHLLAAPLAMNNFLWRTGIAGSLVSMASFVTAGLGLFLILRMMIEERAVVWLGLGIFALNPSWLYYQTTPMQEPLAMALLVLNVLFLVLWQERGSKRYLLLAAAINCLAALNRYEGWFFIALSTAWVLLAAVERTRIHSWRSRCGEALIYGFVASLAPIYWFAHNWFEYGDVWEFIRGPYSARALYLKQIATYHFRYPTEGHWWLSFLYYTKSVRHCAGEIPFWLAAGGLLMVIFRVFSRSPEDSPLRKNPGWSWRTTHLLFLVPFVFYVVSLAKGRAPTYVAEYYPDTNFGVRYGHTAIPAVIVLAGVFLSCLSRWVHTSWLRRTLVGVFLGALLIPVGIAVKTRLHSLPAHEEPYLNNRDDRRILRVLADYLKPRWHGEMILMNSGYLGRVAQLDEIPFRNILFEDNLDAWQFALRYPFPRVQWVLAEEGDEVWKMMTSVPAYRRYYREEKLVRGIREHVIHVYAHHAPVEWPSGEGRR
ncbi:MAG: hypothetical protein WBN92_05905 [Terriglobia bacterium]